MLDSSQGGNYQANVHIPVIMSCSKRSLKLERQHDPFIFAGSALALFCLSGMESSFNFQVSRLRDALELFKW